MSRIIRGNTRFKGAGASAEREFNRQRWQNIRDDWHVWLGLGLGIVGFAVWSAFTAGVAGRVLAAAAGLLAGVVLCAWALGGHISTFRWYLGSEGERLTGKQVELLGRDWHCEHAIQHKHGDWDHVLVGPPGVFLVDSKFLNGTAVAGRSALRAGRLVFHGGAFKGGAADVNHALERRLGRRAPFVHPVVAVWGNFPQELHEEDGVVYVAGEGLAAWLAGLPPKVSSPDRAALVVALKEVRSELAMG